MKGTLSKVLPSDTDRARLRLLTFNVSECIWRRHVLAVMI